MAKYSALYQANVLVHVDTDVGKVTRVQVDDAASTVTSVPLSIVAHGNTDHDVSPLSPEGIAVMNIIDNTDWPAWEFGG